MWARNGAYTLSYRDRDIVLSRRGWLTDKIICAAQMLLLQFLPNMPGLQPPTLQKVFAFQVHSGEFVQIIHTRQKQPLVCCVHSWFLVFLCWARERVSRESQRQWSSTVRVACRKRKVMIWPSVIPATSGITATAWTFPVRYLGCPRSTGSAKGV